MKNKAVHIEDLTVYYDHALALSNANLDVMEGEYLGIIGPNGGGKSTLLKAMLGLVPISSGSIQIFGTEAKNNGSRIGYVPQFGLMDKKFPITLLEVVLTGRLKSGLAPFYRYSKDDKSIARELLNKVGIGHLEDRNISQLSGGEFQKMLIARALAMNPKLLLLDEPTASVDAKSRDQIYSLLDELNKEMTIILVTHDLLAIASNVGRLACLNKELVYHGEPELTETVVNHLYGCPVDLLAHGVPHRVLRMHREENAND